MLVTAAEIISQSFNFYRRHWRQLIIYLSLLFIPTVLLSLLGIGVAYLNTYLPAFSMMSLIIILSVVAATVVFSFWVSIALARVIKTLLTNAVPDGWGKTIADSSRYLGPAIAAAILVALLIMLGTIFLVIPGIIFFVWYVFTFYAVIFDNQGAVSAMKTSKALVVGRWWGVLWRLLAPGVLFGLIAMAIIGLFTVPLTVAYPDSFLAGIIVNLLATIINLAMTPLMSGAVIILYLSAKQTAAPNTPVNQ